IGRVMVASGSAGGRRLPNPPGYAEAGMMTRFQRCGSEFRFSAPVRSSRLETGAHWRATGAQRVSTGSNRYAPAGDSILKSLRQFSDVLHLGEDRLGDAPSRDALRVKAVHDLARPRSIFSFTDRMSAGHVTATVASYLEDSASIDLKPRLLAAGADI